MEDGTVEKFVFGLWRDMFFSMLVFFSYVYIMLHFVPVTVREICHGDSVVYLCVLHIIVLHISSFLNFV